MSNLKFGLLSISLFLHFFLFSCNNESSTNNTILISTDSTLKYANLSLHYSNTTILASIRNKAIDPFSKEVVKPWLQKAELITKFSSDLVRYIDTLKSENKIGYNQSNEVFKALLKYKKDILNLDSKIKHEFEKNIMLPITPFYTIENGESKFYSQYFKKASTIATSTMLSNIQNSIMVIQNKLLNFCHSSTTSHMIVDSFATLLLEQNSTIFKKGETIEIKAGVGSFSFELNPTVLINGMKITNSDGGYFIYNKKVSEIPGKYKIPVRVSFLNQITGHQETQEKAIEYTVAKECDQ